MTTILGIDPGATGAIAQISPMVEAWDMPSCASDLAALLRTFDPATTRVYIERSQPMPQKVGREGRNVDPVSAFNYGRGYGVILGVMGALGLWYREVPSATWKTALHLSRPRGDKDFDPKAASLTKARLLFPEVRLFRKKDHGRAEALLIAYYGRRVGEQEALL